LKTKFIFIGLPRAQREDKSCREMMISGLKKNEINFNMKRRKIEFFSVEYACHCFIVNGVNFTIFKQPSTFNKKHLKLSFIAILQKND
jgi:hypothetical protein